MVAPKIIQAIVVTTNMQRTAVIRLIVDIDFLGVFRRETPACRLEGVGVNHKDCQVWRFRFKRGLLICPSALFPTYRKLTAAPFPGSPARRTLLVVVW